MSGWFFLLFLFHLFPLQSTLSRALDCDKLHYSISPYYDGGKHIKKIFTNCASVDSIQTSLSFTLTGVSKEEYLIFANKSRIAADKFEIAESSYRGFRISGQRLIMKAGSLNVVKNSYLETVQLPNLQHIEVDEFVLSRNPMLKNFTFPENAKINVAKSFTVEGNRRLERKWIDLLKKTLNGKGHGYIQDYGECIFVNSLKDVAELEGCKYVKGDLSFIFGAQQSPTYSAIHLSKITGCVDMQETYITSLSFLKNAVIGCKSVNIIFENPLLCDVDELKGNITGLIADNCHFVCRNLTELMSKKTCHTLNSDLIVDKDTDPMLLEEVKRIKRINGIVKIIGTELNVIDFLKGVMFIVSKRTGPVLIIRDNLNLKQLAFDQLLSTKGYPGLIVGRNTLKVYIKHNGNFKMPKELFKGLQRVLIDPNSIEADVDMKLPKDIYSDRGHDENDKDFDFHESVNAEKDNYNPTKSLYFITVSSAVAVAILFIAEIISIVVKYATFKYKQQTVNMDAKEKRTPKVDPKPVSVTASDRSFFDTPNVENKSSMKAPTESDNSNVTSRNSNPSPVNSDVSSQQVASQNPSSQNPSSQNPSSLQQTSQQQK